MKLYSSEYPKRQPIYIEFYVTHACDEFKLHNGGKVIEVKIESECDIDKIVDQGFIETSKYNKINGCFKGISSNNATMFWNFKAEDYNNTQISHEIKFSRYILYPSGKSQCYQDVSNCRNLVKARKQSQLEICFFNYDPKLAHKAGMYYGYSLFGINNCPICKYYVEDSINNKICWFKDKDLGINIKKPLFEANGTKECPDFILNVDTIYACLNPNEYTILE